jgi:hypothetical protein
MPKTILNAALALFLFAPSVAGQGTNGAIAGTVRDTSGAVIPGVTVEASSPALIEKVRTGVTDSQGQYRISDLRPGTYAVRFMLDGFSTVSREGLELTQGFTAPVNVELRVGALEETITVTGVSPVVDVQGTAQLTVVTRAELTTIPTAEYFGMVAGLVPGLAAKQGDVGGSSGFGAIRMTIHGGTGTDQQVAVNGFIVTTMGVNGDGTTTAVPIEGSIEEQAIEVGGHQAESETGGIRINVVSRSGGNRFSGGAYYNFANGTLQSNNLTPELESLGLATTTKAKALWTFSPSFGGPIKKDTLWFYAGYQKNIVENYAAGSWANTADTNSWTYTPDYSRPQYRSSNTWGANGRLTYQLNQKNRFSFSYEDGFLCLCGAGSSTAAPETGRDFNIWTSQTQVSWSAPVTNRLLLQGGWGRTASHPRHLAVLPQASNHPIRDRGTGVSYSASSTADDWMTSHQDHFRGSLSYVTGSHSFKTGVDMRFGVISPRIVTPVGNANYVLLNGTPDSITYFPGPTREEESTKPNLGLYVQDRWTVARLTADVGLRFDWLRTGYPEQTLAAAQYRPSAVTFPAADVLNWKDLSPRLGVAYDLFGNGKTALKANLSRYVQQETLELTGAQNPVTASNASTTRSWTDRNGDFVVQGNPLNPALNGELGPGSNETFGQPGKITSRIDPNFASGFRVRPHQWQLAAGVQQELMPGLALDVTYARRSYGNILITQNTAVSPASYSPYCVTARVDDRLPDGGGYELCGLFDLNPSSVGLRDNVVRSSSSVGDQIQRWHGVDLLVRTRLPRGVILQGGLSTGKTLTDTCDIVSRIGDATGNPSPLYCRTEEPFLSSLRVSGAYPLPWGSQISAAFRSDPGTAITASGTFTNAQIAPSLRRSLSGGNTATVQLVAPGTMYNERQNQLDLRFAKYLTSGQFRWQAAVDLYNALNAVTVLSQNNTYGTNGATWQRPTTVLAPRLVKFGIRMDF